MGTLPNLPDRYAALTNAMRNSNEAAHAALGLLRGLMQTRDLPAKAIIEREDKREINL